jgi:hypothetical protein
VQKRKTTSILTYRYPPRYLLFYIFIDFCSKYPNFFAERLIGSPIFPARLHPRLVRSIAFERRRSIVQVRFPRCWVLRCAVQSVFSERTYLRISRQWKQRYEMRDETKRGKMRRRLTANSHRTWFEMWRSPSTSSDGIPSILHVPRLVPESPPKRDSRARARIGRVKAECFQPSYSTRNLIRANA